MTKQPTGIIETVAGRARLTITREFQAPSADVWAAITEPERTERWIGTWSGDPASGRVAFRMTAEGDDVSAEDMEIRECVPPTRLAVTSHVGDQQWHLDLDLTEAAGITTLTFTQPDVDPVAAGDIGPGWEYYLDRLVAAVTGGDVGAIDWDRDYYPAMAEHYRPR